MPSPSKEPRSESLNPDRVQTQTHHKISLCPAFVDSSPSSFSSPSPDSNPSLLIKHLQSSDVALNVSNFHLSLHNYFRLDLSQKWVYYSEVCRCCSAGLWVGTYGVSVSYSGQSDLQIHKHFPDFQSILNCLSDFFLR